MGFRIAVEPGGPVDKREAVGRWRAA